MATSGGAGKDTVADYIVNKFYGNNAVKRALGKPIHELAEQFANGKIERHHLQDLGESIRNIFGEEAWIKYLDDKTKEIKEPLVIPDIRKLIEYSHYCVEKGFLPLYIYVDPQVAKERLVERDGGYNEDDLKRSIECQMNFIERLPMETVGKNGLCKVEADYPFNNIYVVNNSNDFSDTKKQLNDWWKKVQDNGNDTCPKY